MAEGGDLLLYVKLHIYYRCFTLQKILNLDNVSVYFSKTYLVCKIKRDQFIISTNSGFASSRIHSDRNRKFNIT